MATSEGEPQLWEAWFRQPLSRSKDSGVPSNKYNFVGILSNQYWLHMIIDITRRFRAPHESHQSVMNKQGLRYVDQGDKR